MKKLILGLLTCFMLSVFAIPANAWVTTQQFNYDGAYVVYVYSEPSHTRIAEYTNPYTWGTCKYPSQCGQQGYRISPPYWYAPAGVNTDIQWAVNYANANGIGWRWGMCGLWANPYPCTL